MKILFSTTLYALTFLSLITSCESNATGTTGQSSSSFNESNVESSNVNQSSLNEPLSSSNVNQSSNNEPLLSSNVNSSSLNEPLSSTNINHSVNNEPLSSANVNQSSHNEPLSSLEIEYFYDREGYLLSTEEPIEMGYYIETIFDKEGRVQSVSEKSSQGIMDGYWHHFIYSCTGEQDTLSSAILDHGAYSKVSSFCCDSSGVDRVNRLQSVIDYSNGNSEIEYSNYCPNMTLVNDSIAKADSLNNISSSSELSSSSTKFNPCDSIVDRIRYKGIEYDWDYNFEPPEKLYDIDSLFNFEVDTIGLLAVNDTNDINKSTVLYYDNGELIYEIEYNENSKNVTVGSFEPIYYYEDDFIFRVMTDYIRITREKDSPNVRYYDLGIYWDFSEYPFEVTDTNVPINECHIAE